MTPKRAVFDAAVWVMAGAALSTLFVPSAIGWWLIGLMFVALIVVIGTVK